MVPEDILSAWRAAGTRGAEKRVPWEKAFAGIEPDTRAEFTRRFDKKLPVTLDADLQKLKKAYAGDATEIATRKASEAILKDLAPLVPELVLGSADLTGSTNNLVPATPAISPGAYAGRFVHWGIREHGMAAAVNGLYLHGGFIPSGATFMVFTDYCRPALRLAALMKAGIFHLMTHDSIGLGEDGPTHQPVEHLAALRAIPDMLVLRPADRTETLECYQIALGERHKPSILALTRQNLPQARIAYEAGNLCARGAYELRPAEGMAAVSLFASGSEVSVALAAQKLLSGRGVPTRVVSVPCFELFFEQDEAYRNAVIGEAPIRVGIEAAVRMGWDAIIGSHGLFVGMRGFGASGPYKKLYEHFGITAEAVADAAMKRHNG